MSSKVEEEVIISKDDGHKQRWYQGVFYKKEGNKHVVESKKVKIYILTGLFLLLVGVMFKDEPIDKEETTDSIDTPTRVSGYQPKIVLNAYEDTKEEQKKIKSKKKYKIERLSLVSSKQRVKIPLGASAVAELVTGGSNGPIKVKLLEDLISHDETYIKEGSILWGRGSSTEERLLISFTKYVDESGNSKEITANAFDSSDQILGLKGSIIGRTSKKIAAGAGLGLAGALQTMQESENLGGVAVTKPNLENALLNGASTAALGIAEQELEELKNKQTIIEVKKGTKILVVFGGI